MGKIWTRFQEGLAHAGQNLLNPAYRKKLTESVSPPKEPTTSETQPILAASYIEPGDPVDNDEHKWRRLTGSDGQLKKDIPEIQREQLLKAVYFLFVMNPLARRIVNMNVDFTLGDGPTISSKANKVQQVVDMFWKDPVNHMEMKGENKARELGLYGTLTLPTFVDEHKGRVRLGYIDPIRVQDITTAPDNCEELRQVILKANMESGESKKYEVIRWLENRVNSLGEREKLDRPMLAGNIFVFRVNMLTNQTFGLSDLSCLVDWLDGYDFLLFSLQDRADLLNRYIWDVEIKGGTPTQIQEFSNRFRMPKPGEVRVHNENIRINAVTPQLNATDMSEAMRMFRQNILAGAGYPEFFFAEGSKTNKSTAGESGLPTIKMLRRRQRVLIDMFRTMIQYQLDQVVLNHPTFFSEEEKKNLDFSIDVPKLDARDAETVASVLSNVATAMTNVVSMGLVRPEFASQALLLYIRELGIDTEEEEKRLREIMAKNTQLRQEEIEKDPSRAQPDDKEIPTIPAPGDGVPDPGPLNERDYDQSRKRIERYTDEINDTIERSVARKRT